MSQERKPERTCVVCRKKFSQPELIRVSLNKSGEFCVDNNKKTAGRGAYICKSCVEKCSKTKAMNRAYKRNVPDNIYEDIKGKR